MLHKHGLILLLRMNASLYRAVVVAFLLALSVTHLRAEPKVICDVADNLNGTLTYSYSIDNTDLWPYPDIWPAPVSVSHWWLYLPLGDWDPRPVSAGGDVLVPPGWSTGFTASIPWQWFHGPSILPGEVLGGFAITSALRPGGIRYEIGNNEDDWIGGTVGPVVPEPAMSIAGAVVFLVGLLAFRLKMLWLSSDPRP